MTAIPPLRSVGQFLFEVPPYAVYQVPSDNGHDILEEFYGRTGDVVRVDGYCPFCHLDSTFTVHGQSIPGGDPWNNIHERVAYDQIFIKCARSDRHTIRYYFRIDKLTVEKIGQYPSLASVASDAVSPYRKGMNDQDAREFHKAIGLAAHGVGVGSFVYLRRVFERLIYSRFEDFKVAEKWKDEEFYAVRMEDKIALLKGHLPTFLVENRKVYSILSIGIHELDEAACLTYFEVMKQAIVIILEDDKRTREELNRRVEFARAIATFAPPKNIDK